MSGLLAELRRRNVIRAAGLYLVGAWLIVQVAGTVLPMFGAPGWVPRTIVILLVLGFIPVLVIAWIFELTPDGLKRDAEVPPDRSIASLTARRMDRLMIAGLVVAVLLLAGQWFRTRDSATPSTAPTPSIQASSEPPHSIAVLPFVNMSQDKDNEHFGDGLSEELLNLLTQVPGLRVAARTSSFHFKGKDATIAEIAAALQVETILEGSVRRSGSTMRVVAQLISAKDGSHLWSGKYDRELDDIFAVQDDIAAQILKALRPRLAPGEAELPKSAQGEIGAELFERFLWARNLTYDGTQASADLAHAEFLAITKAAPNYALGHAWLARSWLAMEERAGGAVSPGIALPAAQAAVDAALAVDPQEAMAHYAQGLLWGRHDDEGKALVAFD
ncbi:MAG TPA: adenylyl cyclase, partial [Candidatus Saccharimonadia bacterium]|nr:adenylyl cyclase [Candidatus Saccharimonadia bacterium]